LFFRRDDAVGYSNNPVKANLYNKAGLPASPFTTEKIK
jgi:hypothetical protein